MCRENLTILKNKINAAHMILKSKPNSDNASNNNSNVGNEHLSPMFNQMNLINPNKDQNLITPTALSNTNSNAKQIVRPEQQQTNLQLQMHQQQQQGINSQQNIYANNNFNSNNWSLKS